MFLHFFLGGFSLLVSMPAENNLCYVMGSSCSNFVCAAEKSTPIAFQDLLCFGDRMYFSYSGIPLSKCRQLSGKGLHLLILMRLYDFVTSVLLATMVQKVAVVCSIYLLEVEGTL